VTRDLSDVSDVVEAYLALVERGVRGEAYNVCRGEGVLLADVATHMAGMATVPIRIEVDPARLRPADVPWLVGDPAKIAAATGWRATTSLDQTLAAVLDHRRRSAA
jgi:GDP-4-dehydro-6-deoxy-D-mannose reductase